MCKRKYITISLEDLSINPEGVIIESLPQTKGEQKMENEKVDTKPQNPFEGTQKPQAVDEVKPPEKSDRPSIGREAGRAFLVGAAWGAGVCLGLSVVSIAVGLLVHNSDDASAGGWR